MTSLPMTASKTLAEWERLARASVRDLTDEQYQRVGETCHAAETRGEFIGTWHGASIVLGQLEICPCSPCTKKRDIAKNGSVVLPFKAAS